MGFVTEYVSPLLSRAGAAPLTDDTLIDHHGVAWHYGDPLGEQRFTSAIIDRSHRVVIAVSGPDAPAFLNNLVSQKLDDAPDGFSAAALDLDAQGHILHHMDVTRREGTFYLDVPRPQADSLLDYLRKMVFWSDVTIDVTNLGILTLFGTLPLPDDCLARTIDWAGPPRTDLFVERTLIDATTAQLESAGGQLAGLMTFTAARVNAREPELAADLDAKSIPHESPELLRRAVHLDKGCYRGQETVSRVHNLGRSPRALVLLHLDGSAPTQPAPGTPITSGGRTVGRLGTVVHDHELGPIALGLVKRSAMSATLVAGDTALAVDPDSIPDDSTPRPGRAAIDRLRGL
ncbi:YgfZ/GcvT domain-containing protein [Corynebacterium hindlerae]|uniref:CAF17-like 4Fe-4S cluster assembly/insertion protein YgfZ n=1 Tax=Corynebacterium hindlerae TaxID=699041 RepID=UPI003AAD0A07